MAIGIGAAAGVIILFVGFVLVSKFGLRTALVPWDLAAMRFAVAGSVMLPVALKHGFLGLGPRRVLLLAGSGGLGFALCAYWGFALAPAHHGSALVHGTLPLTTALVSCILLRTRPNRWQLCSSIAVAAGAAAILGTSLAAADRGPVMGDLLLLGASLCWSSFGVLSNRWRPPPFAAAALVAVVSAALYLPLYLAAGVGHLHEAALRDIAQQAVFQGLAIGVGSILVYSIAVASIGPGATALAAAAVPTLTATGAMLLLGESLAKSEVIGLALVTLGIILGSMGLGARLRSSRLPAP
ncbi:MAG: DMT family transporter [Burkholderiales bacterium]|nr:DMT family transporter [Burkholderiales bacterium]